MNTLANSTDEPAWIIRFIKEINIIEGDERRLDLTLEAIEDALPKHLWFETEQYELIRRLVRQSQPIAFLVRKLEGDTLIAMEFSIPWGGTPVKEPARTKGDVTFGLDEACCLFTISESNPSYHVFVKAIDLTLLGLDQTVLFVTGQNDNRVLHCEITTNSPPLCDGTPVNTLELRPRTIITLDIAAKMFNLINRCRCYAPGGLGGCNRDHQHNDSCIPFSYPIGGCEARAHKACQLLENANYAPKTFFKVFVRLSNDVCSPFAPPATLPWKYHFAPAVLVDNENSIYVLDPSLFNVPVSLADWAQRIGAPIEQVEKIPSTAFGIKHHRFTIDNALCMDRVLAYYRARLDAQICYNDSCPVEQHCP